MVSNRHKLQLKIKTISLLTAVLLLSGQTLSIAQAANYVFGQDTVAGVPTLIKARGFSPNQALNLHLVKPDGVDLGMATKANQAGEADTLVDGYHTTKAGTYFAYASSGNFTTSQVSFTVFAGEIDENKSEVELSRAVVAADGQDNATISLVMKDAYGNPVEGKAMKLIPSKKAAIISPNVAVSDKEGKASFKVKSSQAGLINFTVMDTTADDYLENHPEVSFVNGNEYLADAGGDIIKIANAAGPLAGFEITDLPASVKPSENVTFKVKAVDASKEVVQDYTGTIRFSAEGTDSSGVALPANYKFLAEDLGQHQFNLGLSFAKAGSYKISVNDLTDKLKKGEINVTVSSGTSTTTTSSSGDKPVISAPAAGTYSQAEQTVTGTAKPSSSVKIMDNNAELASVPVGPTGKFSYQTPALAEGKHSIYIVNVDAISLEVISNSDPVDINIDTTPPALDDIVLDPSEGIKSGDVINVKVYSEKNLSQVALLFNYDIVQLNASLDDASVYVGTIQAPADPGEYKLGVLVADELSNEKTYEEQATVKVVANGEGTIDKNPDLKPTTPTDTTTTPEDTSGEVRPAAGAPSAVSGLVAYGSDKKVTLVWDAATDDKKVQNYKVYYGQTVQDMTQVALTKDASTTWYIPNLENRKEYFFAVSAVDDEGNESSAKSEIVSGIPFILEVNNALTEKPTKPLDDPALHEAAYNGPFPENTSKTGPELILLVGASGLGSSVWFSRKKKK